MVRPLVAAFAGIFSLALGASALAQGAPGRTPAPDRSPSAAARQ
ncbi:MAG: hypothetical protein JWP86_2940, partial [Phenylobacterium sp.]|nr:hypothetical protein [Phenylobacterium sp.]